VLSERVVSWVADAVGDGARVVAMKSLHGDGGPWLLRIEHGVNTDEAVLRVPKHRWLGADMAATGAAALHLAEKHGVAAARLIASDLDGRATGVPATLETVVPGSSASPPKVSVSRLRVAGAAIAKIHKIPLESQPDLPLRVRSLQGPARLDDRALERRWAALYQAAPDSEKPNIVEALCEMTGWSAPHARQVMTNTQSTPLLQRGDDTLRAISHPQGRTVFVHADLWAGNMMWDGDTSVTLIDWKDSGVGEPGVDVGHLRMKMAVQYGLDAATHVLEGWQKETGREATYVPYWDVVAAVHTPTELDDWEPGFDDSGTRLTSAGITERRDAFLRNALDQLDPEITGLRHLDENTA
jgi:aminoglycoside phosphotransferase (APT) family kinase protein